MSALWKSMVVMTAVCLAGCANKADVLAGSEEQSPKMSTEELVQLIKQVKRKPIERDTLYNVVKDYSEVVEF